MRNKKKLSTRGKAQANKKVKQKNFPPKGSSIAPVVN